MKKIYLYLALALMPFTAGAQARYFSSAKIDDTAPSVARVVASAFTKPDSLTPRSLDELHAYLDTMDMSTYDILTTRKRLDKVNFLPSVYTGYEAADTTGVFTPDYGPEPYTHWLDEAFAEARTMNRLKRYLYFNHPDKVCYNINLLPSPPKRFHAVINPEDHTIEVLENVSAQDLTSTIEAKPVKLRHWMRTFTASLQFSQAYVSPNWYQGGNTNLNMIGQLYYNVKLNPELHPNLLFETTAQSKLGMNSAPDDSIHNYNISDDLFQVNTTFGLKAAKKWYYSFTGQLKTQLFNYYPSNDRQLRSAFMSPGELTMGLGMTYNTTNKRKNVTFDASIAPLSYSLKTCINSNVDPTLYNIDEGRKTKNKFGSSAELKLWWKICRNITFNSRLFAFTDYDAAYMDWENTLQFEINRFLTTQVYAHMRYDTSTPPCDDPSWKKFQVKEIISVGFAYKFSSL